MRINTKENYIEIGTSVNADNSLNDILRLPAPTELPSSNEFLADAERNANGTMSIQQIGRTQYTTSIKWTRLDRNKWWEINRWFEEYGYVFYMKYFSHTDGRVKIHQFYRGNIDKGEPSHDTELVRDYNVPIYYKNCGFSLIDIGQDDVIIVEELGVN